MLLDYLQNEYPTNVPIFMGDIEERLGMQAASVRQGFKRLVDRGILARFTAGVYYFPQPSRIFKSVPLDIEKVIFNKYIEYKGKPIGYYTGITLANIAGLTTQIAAEKCIATNEEKSRGRVVMVKNRRLRLKKPRIMVDAENRDALMILDLVSEAMKYSEYGADETATRLRNYAKRQNVSKEVIVNCLSAYPGKTSKLLLEMRIYDVLA